MTSADVVSGKLTPTGTVGHYGCQAGDRIVRVGVVEGVDKGPAVIEVDPCPACGNRHMKVKPNWRRPTDLDEGRKAEVLVDAEGVPR